MDDILFDNGFIFKNGDFAIGDSRKQETEAIMRASKGTFAWSPLIGFAINKRLNAPIIPSEFKQDLKKALKADNIKLTDFAINSDGLFINTERIK